MEEMTLEPWMNDTSSSRAAGLQYVSLRVVEGREREENTAEGWRSGRRGRVKGEGRVILILFMNGWIRVCV